MSNSEGVFSIIIFILSRYIFKPCNPPTGLMVLMWSWGFDRIMDAHVGYGMWGMGYPCSMTDMFLILLMRNVSHQLV